MKLFKTTTSYILLILGVTLSSGCADDIIFPSVTETDISVSAKTDYFYFISSADLDTKISSAFEFEHGTAPEEAINKTITINGDSTKVTATIEIKPNYRQRFIDTITTNNRAVINIEKGRIISTDPDAADGDPWEKCQLTYSFMSYTEDVTEEEQILSFIHATEVWSDAIDGLTFEQLDFNDPTADIRIEFTTMLTHPPCPTTFNIIHLGHAFYPGSNDLSGDIHFNDNYDFSVDDTIVKIDFQSVAMHELGHSLGLGHINNGTAIMSTGYIPGTARRGLTELDKEASANLYGSVCP